MSTLGPVHLQQGPRGRRGHQRAFCRSYVHMHINRLLGMDLDQERTTLDLLRRTHESIAHFPPTPD
ncbi:lantibiotic dehydratase C-terminal domain-containing protein [Streptomyces sp. ISL-44]|uniref:lantibiotic dehydratase C-terminal domain-containing protein n=1 Tax=Streptomyces sp. ISL-44 TaxID=2819184 RepID=UPI0035ABBDFD